MEILFYQQRECSIAVVEAVDRSLCNRTSVNNMIMHRGKILEILEKGKDSNDFVSHIIPTASTMRAIEMRNPKTGASLWRSLEKCEY